MGGTRNPGCVKGPPTVSGQSRGCKRLTLRCLGAAGPGWEAAAARPWARREREFEFAVEVAAGPPSSIFRHTKVRVMPNNPKWGAGAPRPGAPAPGRGRDPALELGLGCLLGAGRCSRAAFVASSAAW